MQVAVLSSRTTAETFACQDFEALRHALSKHNIKAVRVNWQDHDVSWQAEHFQAVVIRSVWNYDMENTKELKHVLSIISSRTRLFNSLDIIQWNISKRYMIDFQKAGVRVIPTRFFTATDFISDLDGWLNVYPSNLIVVKPTVSSNSHNTRIVHTERKDEVIATKETIKTILNFGDRDVMVQPFESAISESGEYQVVCIGGKISHVVRKRPTKAIRPGSEQVGEVEKVEVTSIISNFVDSILDIMKKMTYDPLICRIDFLLIDDITTLLEVEAFEPWLYPEVCPDVYDKLAKHIHMLLT